MPLNQPACTSQTATPALHFNRSRDVAQNSRRPGRPLLGGAPLPRMASSTFRCAATRCEAGAWSRGHVWPSPIAPRAHSGVSAHAVRLSPAFLCFCETRPRGHAAASALATLGQRTCTVGVGTLFFLVKFVYCIRSASSIAGRACGDSHSPPTEIYQNKSDTASATARFRVESCARDRDHTPVGEARPTRASSNGPEAACPAAAPPPTRLTASARPSLKAATALWPSPCACFRRRAAQRA